ncbi:MAG: ABC transporter permease [Candidatus Thorarchaeota archaeon]
MRVDLNPEEVSFFQKVKENLYLRFVIRKLFFYLVILFVALSITWFIPRLIPGDPLNYLFQQTGTGNIAWVNRRKEELREFYGLDLPLHEQFINFWKNILHFDLGYSFEEVKIKVIDRIEPFFYMTIILVLPVLILGFFLGNYIGGKAATSEGILSKIIYYIGVSLQSAPYYWTALVTMIIFFLIDDSTGFHLFPSKWRILTIEYLFKNPLVFLNHYIIPFIVMLLFTTGGWATGMRAMMLYEMDSPYLIYSKQLGFKKELIESYARRNAILPQITGLNLRLNELIGVTLVVEYVFQYPGLGRIIIESAQSRNYPLIIGSFVVIILITVIGNFLIDILYGFIDPRIRSGSPT